MSRSKIIMFENCDEEINKRQFQVTRSNPAYWQNDGVRNKFDYVFAPSYPNIEKAYYDKGKKIYRAGEDKKVEPKVVEDNTFLTGETESSTSVEQSTEESFSSESEQVETEKSWRDLGWIEMRSKAKEFTEEVVKNKEDAIAVLEKAEQDGLL